MGHEDRGLSKAALARCDQIAYLPQLGKVASLNVAPPPPSRCYEVRRRAWTADTADHPRRTCSRTARVVALRISLTGSVQRGSDSEGVDGDAEAAGGTGRGGQGVEQRLVVGGTEQPVAVGRAQDVDADRVARARR